MARETRSDARVASEGPSPTMKGGGLHNRSAGACPPRALECAERWRGTGPRPTVTHTVFYRSAGACPPRASSYVDDGEGHPLGCACGIRGPKPYDEGRLSAALLHRDQEGSSTGPSAFCSL